MPVNDGFCPATRAQAYVELSGQTAATQAVVADLRRCATFLQMRCVGEGKNCVRGAVLGRPVVRG